jgi:hypothetical protein
MSEFTKGPWSYTETEDGVVVIMGSEASVLTGKDVIYMNGDNCNAHLIAAAPDMYDLLKRLTSHDNCKKDIVHLLGEADSLLAKARGEI